MISKHTPSSKKTKKIIMNVNVCKISKYLLFIHLYFTDIVGPCFIIYEISPNHFKKTNWQSVIIPPHNMYDHKRLNIDDITCASFSQVIKSSLLAALHHRVWKQSAVTKISWQADGEMKVANKP